MNFAEIPDDERSEWRDDPVTQAFIEWMRKEAVAMNVGAVAAIREAANGALESISNAGQYVGKLEAFERSIDTATRETFE